MLLGIITSPMMWLVVGIIVVLLFGNRLPSVMRSLGQGMTEFKKGLNDGHQDETKQVEDSGKAGR